MRTTLKKYAFPTLLLIFLAFFLVLIPNQTMAAVDPITGPDILGPVTAPESVMKINAASGGQIGALFLFSRFIRFGTIVAGAYVVWNFISAGFTYISSAGNTATHATVRDKLTWSVVGIIIIVAAYAIVGILSFVIFKDATFMLNPQLEAVVNIY